MISSIIQILKTIDPSILFFVYVMGFLASYILIKIIRDQIYINTWSYVIIGFLLSIGSWVTFFTILIVIGVIYLINFIDHEPPKWL